MKPLLRLIGWALVALAGLKLAGVIVVAIGGWRDDLDWIQKQLIYAMAFASIGIWLARLKR